VASFEEGGLVFDLKSRACCELNPGAILIISLIKNKKSIKEIFYTYADYYEQPEDILKEDFNIFLEDLIKRGWVHVEERK